MGNSQTGAVSFLKYSILFTFAAISKYDGYKDKDKF